MFTVELAFNPAKYYAMGDDCRTNGRPCGDRSANLPLYKLLQRAELAEAEVNVRSTTKQVKAAACSQPNAGGQGSLETLLHRAHNNARGVVEVSGIMGLASVATQLSKGVIDDIATKYKAVTSQIESFGNEIGDSGGIIVQLSRLLNKKAFELKNAGSELITYSIFDQSKALFGELETYKESLYGNLVIQKNIFPDKG
ncbi:MAG: hypothetical protein Q9214_001306 [Letrouitia sp. 1 TL-2023]